MNDLALVVQERFGVDPFDGAAFVFRAKRANKIKVLISDRYGLQASRRSEVRLATGAGRGHEDVARTVLGALQGGSTGALSDPNGAAAGTGRLAATERVEATSGRSLAAASKASSGQVRCRPCRGERSLDGQARQWTDLHRVALGNWTGRACFHLKPVIDHMHTHLRDSDLEGVLMPWRFRKLASLAA